MLNLSGRGAQSQAEYSARIEDLAKYGLMPELLGRIGTILAIPPLKLEDYRQLLFADKGSVQYKYSNYLSLYGVSFSMSESGVRAVAQRCMRSNTGARAVNPLVDGVMRRAIVAVENDETINQVIFDADGDECCVRYEHGPRKSEQAEATKENSEELPWHTVKANNSPALVRKLCRYYRNANGDSEVMCQLEPFLNSAVPYLHKRCDKKDFTLQSLLILANQTRRNDAKHLLRKSCIDRFVLHATSTRSTWRRTQTGYPRM